MKKQRTRKQRALRWMTALFCVILLGNLSGAHLSLPSLTIQPLLQEYALDETRIVHTQWETSAPMIGKPLYLSENEQIILLSAAAYELMLGWYTFGPGIQIDRNNPDSFHASWVASKDEHIWVCRVGYVPHGGTPPVYSVGLCRRSDTYLENVGYLEFVDTPMTVTPTENIPVQGGMCYLTSFKLPPRTDYETSILIAQNENGHLSELSNYCWTSVG